MFNCYFDINEQLVDTDSLIRELPFPEIIKDNEKMFSAESAYQMVSFLMGVIKRGTAKNITNFDYQIAGKTGTINETQDAWFIGFSSEITGVVGFDVPKSLEKFETGSKEEDFLRKIYIRTEKPKPFNIPKSIKFINIDIATGKL